GIDFGTDANARGVGNNAGTKTATHPAGDFTVLTWINPVASDLTGNFRRFIDTSSNEGAITTGYRLFTASGADSDNFRFLGRGSGNTSIVHTRALSAGQWQMLAVRYDIDGSATVNVLRDNDLVDAAFVAANNESTSATGAIQYAASESPNFATTDSPNSIQSFNGLMDDAGFFNGILTDRQIANAFQSGAANAFGFALANYDFQTDGSVTSTAPLVVAGPVSVGSGIPSPVFGGGNGDDTGRDASARPLGTTSDRGSLRVTRAGGVNQHNLADAIADDDYFSLTIDGEGSFLLDLESFMFKAALRRPVSGDVGSPDHWALLSDLLSFDAANAIDQGTITTRLSAGNLNEQPGQFQSFAVDLSDQAFQGLDGPLELRLYTWGDETNNGSAATRFDKFTVNGSVVVPEPSTFVLAALGLLGLGFVARRRKR
ncbi:MAG: PEP-CTERM sorting domain-containing protein, partial [Planctomycetes bacterium]|nr:PEP-CTERM sorting domain-containing protein [Planctomycetota bacterium]